MCIYFKIRGGENVFSVTVEHIMQFLILLFFKYKIDYILYQEFRKSKFKLNFRVYTTLKIKN